MYIHPFTTMEFEGKSSCLKMIVLTIKMMFSTNSVLVIFISHNSDLQDIKIFKVYLMLI